MTDVHYGGSMQNEILKEEHDHDQWAKRTSLVSAATIYAVVNTGSSSGGLVTLASSPNFIGIVTVANPGSSSNGNVTLNPSPNNIGLVTVSNLPAYPSGYGYTDPNTLAIGGYDSANEVIRPLLINAPNEAGGYLYVQQKGNMTLSDSKGFIGLVSVSGFTNPLPVSFSGNVTLDAGSKTAISGNLTLSDSKGYIGLVSVSHSAWADPKTFIGLATVTNAVAWPDPKGYIGLVTITGSLSAAAGNVTLDDGSLVGLVDPTDNTIKSNIYSTASGSMLQICISSRDGHSADIDIDGGLDVHPVSNVTLNASNAWIGLVTASNGLAWTDPKTYIGLVTATMSGSVNTGMTTLFPGPNFIGLVTVAPHALTASTVYVGLTTTTLGIGTQKIGLVTLSASNAYIGLVSAQLGVGTQGIGLVTLYASNANIGLVTVNRNSLSTTIAVSLTATNISGSTLWVSTASKKSYITNLMLSANATVGINIKTGTTYLLGNNSVYVTLYPGGGWVENSGPLTPLYSSMTVAEAFEICTNTAAMVAGRITWFDE